MPPGRSTGMALRSMLLISRRTEVRLVPGKTAPQRKKGGLERRVAGTFTGRPHEQAASLCRWPRTPIGGHRHGRSTCRRHPDRIGARCHFCSPPGTRSASKTSHSPARGPCIWGAQVASADPVPQDSVHLPGARRRQSTSLEARGRRRLSAFLRSPGVQGRNVVERAINRLMDFRAVATRYDKRGYHYLATVTVATIIQWLF